MSERPQPTEEREIANACYIWRKKIQSDMVDAMRSSDVTLDDAQWWFDRYRSARIREAQTELAAREAENRK